MVLADHPKRAHHARAHCSFAAAALVVLARGGRTSEDASPGSQGRGGIVSAEFVGGTTSSGGKSVGGSGAGGHAGLGGTGGTSGGGGAAGSGPRPPLAVFTNGEWVDFRIAIEPETRGVEIHLAPLEAGAAFVSERVLLFDRSSDVAPRLALIVSPVSTVTPVRGWSVP